MDVKTFFVSGEAVKKGIGPIDAYIIVSSKLNKFGPNNQSFESTGSNGDLVVVVSPKVKRRFGLTTGSRV
ncbi:hypothetical protein [Bacillus pseudomycoides]|nr:hypothetical protein [Bacillus pseudomycoides]MDF2084928.1 hypothetical protein [Bacillus pseudomycoides]